LAQDFGDKEGEFMKKEIVEYVDNPELGELEVVDDLLPSPERLAKADRVVKVTIGLSHDSIEFFKEQAKQHNTSYQRMIRRLLDEYVAQVRATEAVKQPR
jgi:predicted DNA binding CopG/RHH family protein